MVATPYLESEQPPSFLSMGWLRLLGSLKLQVSFAEYRLFYRALLQKRPVILRSLLMVATPYLESEQPQSFLSVGWLRLVGSLKLQVSFAEYRLFYRALLQKRPQSFLSV